MHNSEGNHTYTFVSCQSCARICRMHLSAERYLRRRTSGMCATTHGCRPHVDTMSIVKLSELSEAKGPEYKSSSFVGIRIVVTPRELLR